MRNTEVQTQLIEDLMDTSRIVSGKLRLEIGDVDLGNVIDQAVQAIEPAAQAKNITVEKNIDQAIGIVHADQQRLQQILWNLLSNAVKFTPERGWVSIRTNRKDEDLEVVVSDNGIGIEPDFLPYVFEKFTQKEASLTRRAGGLGLGMSITKKLVEMHGGTIRAYSEGAKKGSTFILKLPLPLIRGSGTATTKPAEVRNVLRGKTILLVEDDDSAREITKILLQQAGATVIAVDAAPPAIEAFTKSRPSIVISDISLPNIDGYTLIQSLRTMEGAGNGNRTPAMALTAHAREEDKRRAFDAGFDAHLSKPIDLEKLVPAIAEILDASAKLRQESTNKGR